MTHKEAADLLMEASTLLSDAYQTGRRLPPRQRAQVVDWFKNLGNELERLPSLPPSVPSG